MAARTRWQRLMDWWFEEQEPWNVWPLNPPVKTGNPFAYASQHASLDRPTTEELADLLEQLTAEGMPPRLQVQNMARHWPGMVREEGEK